MRATSSTLIAAAVKLLAVLIISNAHAQETPSPWIKSPKNPVLSLGKEGDFNSQNILAPNVVKDGGRYFGPLAGGGK